MFKIIGKCLINCTKCDMTQFYLIFDCYCYRCHSTLKIIHYCYQCNDSMFWSISHLINYDKIIFFNFNSFESPFINVNGIINCLENNPRCFFHDSKLFVHTTLLWWKRNKWPKFGRNSNSLCWNISFIKLVSLIMMVLLPAISK